YPIPSGPIFGQQFSSWGVKQEDIDEIPVDQFPHGRRLVGDPNDDEGWVVAWQLLEVAPQDRISGKNRDGNHERLSAPSADRNYATGRSPMTTCSAVGVPPRYQSEINGAPDAFGSEQPHDFPHALDRLSIPGRDDITDENPRTRGRSLRVDAHDQNAALPGRSLRPIGRAFPLHGLKASAEITTKDMSSC